MLIFYVIVRQIITELSIENDVVLPNLLHTRTV